MSVLKESLLEAANAGLFNVKLDKKWEVPAFQFYMGDLANTVAYAGNFAADDPF